MRHYYQILNYVYLNRLEQALAECHRAMVYINDSVAEDEYDVFARSRAFSTSVRNVL